MLLATTDGEIGDVIFRSLHDPPIRFFQARQCSLLSSILKKTQEKVEIDFLI